MRNKDAPRAINADPHPDPSTGAIMVPIDATYRFSVEADGYYPDVVSERMIRT
jgi:hypothetical protein